jgi:hypothetical protein
VIGFPRKGGVSTDTLVIETSPFMGQVSWWHDRIQFFPMNPAFEPITLEPEDAGDLMVVRQCFRAIQGKLAVL